MDDLRKRLVGTLSDGTRVYLVDGEAVRAAVNVDVTGGGNGLAYQGGDPPGVSPNGPIPADEIWVERGPGARSIIVHEVVEYLMMRYAGWDYVKAHTMANTAEAAQRATSMVPANESRDLAGALVRAARRIVERS